MKVTKNQLWMLIREELEDVLGRDNPNRGQSQEIKFPTPSEKDLARKYRAEKPKEQDAGKRKAAEEVMNLIGKYNEEGYYDAADILYAAFDELTRAK